VRVIAFTGLPASGKSAAVAVARERGLPVVRMGDLVLAEVERRRLPLEESHIGPVATGMRREHGEDVWARRTMERLRDEPTLRDAPLIVVDGVRSLAEIAHFRRMLRDDFVLVAIEAPTAVRHARLSERGRSDDPQSLELIAARDAREKGWGVEEAIRRADHRLANDGGLDALREQIAALLDRLSH
jgi:dephospho-CoA kinase